MKNAMCFARISMFAVFFWFGFLKVIGVSPAHDLVIDLLDKTLPFIPDNPFVIFLGVWEALVGVLFLFKKTTKWAFYLLVVQMFTTFGPLVFLLETSWQTNFLVPTLVGQYILKNLILLALGWLIYLLWREEK